MVQVITKSGKLDMVKVSMLKHFVATGYVVSLA